MSSTKDIEDVKLTLLETEGLSAESECFLDRIGEVGALRVLISSIETGHDGHGIRLRRRNSGVLGAIGVKCTRAVHDFGRVSDF